MFRYLFITLIIFFNHNAFSEMRHFQDILGREINLEVPVKRAVLGFYFPDYIAVAGADNFQYIKGISKEFWQKFNPGSYQLFLEKMPELEEKTDVGYLGNNSFSVEKALSLNPDAIIIPKIHFSNLENDLHLFEALNIPIIVVDFNEQSLENHLKSIEIFGILSGEEARAKAISEQYAQGVSLIQERIKKHAPQKRKIYIEFGDKGPAEYSYTFGKNMWGSIIEQAGGENISAPYIENWGFLNPEQMIISKPEVIVITGTENNYESKQEIMAMGINIQEDEAKKRLQGFLQREGWQELPAVKNGEIYGAYHTASRSITDLASLQFIAKALYPELFQDLDPEKTYLEFHKKYLPITPQGSFFIKL